MNVRGIGKPKPASGPSVMATRVVREHRRVEHDQISRPPDMLFETPDQAFIVYKGQYIRVGLPITVSPVISRTDSVRNGILVKQLDGKCR